MTATPETPQLDLERYASGTDRRVRIVTPTFDPEPIGTPLYTGELARWLRSGGWDVNGVTAQPHYPGFRSTRGTGAGRRDAVDGIPAYRLPTLVSRKGTFAWRAISDANFLGQGMIARRRGRRLFLAPAHLGDPSLTFPDTDEVAELPVRTARLDEVVHASDLDRPILLKIDAQGGELAVLEGASDLLPDDAPRSGLPVYVASFGTGARPSDQRVLVSAYGVGTVDSARVAGRTVPVRTSRETNLDVATSVVETSTGTSREVVFAFRTKSAGGTPRRVTLLPHQPAANEALGR